MYIHEAEQLIPDGPDKALFHPAARFLVQKTPLESLLDESSKVIFRRAVESHLVYVTYNFTLLSED